MDAQRIVVAGDAPVTWHVVRDRPAHRIGAKRLDTESARAFQTTDGAHLLADLIRQAIIGVAGSGVPSSVQVDEITAPVEAAGPRWSHDHRYRYSVWTRMARSHDDAHPSNAVWRVEEVYGAAPWDGSGATDPPRFSDCTGGAELLVLYDGGLGFWSDPGVAAKVLDHALRCGAAPILSRFDFSEPEGAFEARDGRLNLWSALDSRGLLGRAVAVVPARELRHFDVQIGRDLSWERLAGDLFTALTQKDGQIAPLSQCRAVIVSFDIAGALCLEAVGGRRRCTLHYDSTEMEGEWERRHPGRIIESNCCLVAGLAKSLLRNPSDPPWAAGIRAGLEAKRALRLGGYDGHSNGLRFPHERVSTALHPSDAEKPRYAVTGVPETGLSEWTILPNEREKMLALAEGIVTKGLEAVQGSAPVVRFGGLVTLDRREIEGLRSVRRLVIEYRGGRSATAKPLSIAVFAPPGAGKSYCVRSLAESMAFKEDSLLVFNVAQFRNPSDLAKAFQRVRDTGLRGALPFVLWDEFDAAFGEPYFWLRHFLAPMEEGEFLEDQIMHPIGRAIFVFAGSSCSCWEDFKRLFPAPGEGAGSTGDGTSPLEVFPHVKGRDFISRLLGYVNVSGVNREEGAEEKSLGKGARTSASDSLRTEQSGRKGGSYGEGVRRNYYLVRRAIIIRSFIARKAPHLLSWPVDGMQAGELLIDKGVLMALLQTGAYTHGARSIQAVLSMSMLSGCRRFERSCLPPKDQLDLHVDREEFQKLLDEQADAP